MARIVVRESVGEASAMEHYLFHYASLGIERSLSRWGKQASLANNDPRQDLRAAKF